MIASTTSMTLKPQVSISSTTRTTSIDSASADFITTIRRFNNAGTLLSCMGPLSSDPQSGSGLLSATTSRWSTLSGVNLVLWNLCFCGVELLNSRVDLRTLLQHFRAEDGPIAVVKAVIVKQVGSLVSPQIEHAVASSCGFDLYVRCVCGVHVCQGTEDGSFRSPIVQLLGDGLPSMKELQIDRHVSSPFPTGSKVMWRL